MLMKANTYIFTLKYFVFLHEYWNSALRIQILMISSVGANSKLICYSKHTHNRTYQLGVQADQVLVLVYRMLSEKSARNPTVLKICFRNTLHYMLLEVYCNIKYF